MDLQKWEEIIIRVYSILLILPQKYLQKSKTLTTHKGQILMLKLCRLVVAYYMVRLPLAEQTNMVPSYII